VRVGQYLKRVDWGDPNVASDRIRGEWVMKFCPGMEEWKPGQTYDAVIFHTASSAIAVTSGVKLLDVCDPMWTPSISEFRRRVQTVDGIVAATDELKRLILEIVSKPVRVIGDGHDFGFYGSRDRNLHTRQARIAVWFGYADNSVSVKPLLPVLKSHRLRLKVIAERNPFPGVVGVDFCKWNLADFVREVSLCDFALLPPTQSHKTNNKDISALLSGIPVAKTSGDVARFMDPVERQKEMTLAPGLVAPHDVRDRAREYIEWIRELKLKPGAESKDSAIIQYTAICGGYDHSRSDIMVFGDTPANKFTDPVMNAKAYKILPHQFVDAPLRIWMDGNIYPKKDATALVGELLGDYDIAVFKHPWRKCLYEEHTPARQRLAPKFQTLIDEQVGRYQTDGMPRDFALAECGVIVSRACEITREFFDRWWSEVTRYSSRDQMSFPYVWWRMRDRIRVRLVEAKTRFGEWFQYRSRDR
jgi:hypothetical protein